jgi:hypothetical protein
MGCRLIPLITAPDHNQSGCARKTHGRDLPQARFTAIDPNPAGRQLRCVDTVASPYRHFAINAVHRHIETWPGISAEFVQVTSEARIAFS